MRPLLLAIAVLIASLGASSACVGRLVDGAAIFEGPVCIPAEPKRIVVLDPYYNLGMSLEVEAAIVGAPLYGMADEGLKAKAEAMGVADIGHLGQPSIERIVALKPDLILGDAFLHGRVLETVSRIAPTVLIQGQDWKSYYATVADVTGRKGAADKAFAIYDARVEGLRARMPDSPVSVLRIIPGGFHVYLDGPGAYAPFGVLRDAGVKRTPYETTTDDTVLKRPDWEGLSALEGTVLLYIVGGFNDADEMGRMEAEVLANPLWRMIPAVAAGRAYKVDPVTWMQFSGLASAHRVLDDVERTLLNPP